MVFKDPMVSFAERRRAMASTMAKNFQRERSAKRFNPPRGVKCKEPLRWACGLVVVVVVVKRSCNAFPKTSVPVGCVSVIKQSEDQIVDRVLVVYESLCDVPFPPSPQNVLNPPRAVLDGKFIYLFIY